MAKKISFEEGMQQLEMLARALEDGDMTLEASFKAYEQALKLKKTLTKMLDDGDKRIRLLTENGEEEFEPEDAI